MMDNPGYKEDELAATTEIPAPFASIVLVGDPKSTGTKQHRAKNAGLQQTTPQSSRTVLRGDPKSKESHPQSAKDVGIRQATQSPRTVLHGDPKSKERHPQSAKDAVIRQATLPAVSTVLVDDPKSIWSKPKRASDLGLRHSTPQSPVRVDDRQSAGYPESVKDVKSRYSTLQSVINTNDNSGTRRTETIVYGHRGEAEVTFINIEIERSDQKDKDATPSVAQVDDFKASEQRGVLLGQYTNDNSSKLLDEKAVIYPEVRTTKNNMTTSRSAKGKDSTYEDEMSVAYSRDQKQLTTSETTNNNRSKMPDVKAKMITSDKGLQRNEDSSQPVIVHRSKMLDTKAVINPRVHKFEQKTSMTDKTEEEIKRHKSTLVAFDVEAPPPAANVDKIKQSRRLLVPESQKDKLKTNKEQDYINGDRSQQEAFANEQLKTDQTKAIYSSSTTAESSNTLASQQEVSKAFGISTFPETSKIGEGAKSIQSDDQHSLHPNKQSQLDFPKITLRDTSTISDDNIQKLVTEQKNLPVSSLAVNPIKISRHDKITEDKHAPKNTLSIVQQNDYSGDKSERQTEVSPEIQSASRDSMRLEKNTSINNVSTSDITDSLQRTNTVKGDSKLLFFPGNSDHGASEFLPERDRGNALTDFTKKLSKTVSPKEYLDDTLSSSAFYADESMSASSVERREGPSGSSEAGSPTSKQHPQLQYSIQQLKLRPSQQLHNNVSDSAGQPNRSFNKSDASKLHKARRHGVQHDWTQLKKSEKHFNEVPYKAHRLSIEESHKFDSTNDKSSRKSDGNFVSDISENNSLTQIHSSSKALKRWDQNVCEDLSIHSNYKKPLDVEVRKGIMYVQHCESDNVQRSSPEMTSRYERKIETAEGIPLRRKSVTFDRRNVQTDSDDTSLSRFFMGAQQRLSVYAKEPTFRPSVSMFNNQHNFLRGDKSPSELSEIDVNDSASQREWRRSRSVHDGNKSKGNVTTNVHDMDTFRIQRRVSGQSKSQPKSSNTTESFGDENVLRVNVVGYDNNEEVALDRVKSWVTETDSRVDLTSDLNTRTDSPIPFDRHSIAEIPLKIITTSIPIESDDNSVSFKDSRKHTKLSASTSLGTSERKKDKDEVTISTRREPEGSEGYVRKSSLPLDDSKRPILKKKRKSVGKVTQKEGNDVIELADLGEQSRTTRTLSNASVFDPAILEGWTPSSPYATRLQRKTSTRSEGSQNISGKPKVRQLSLAIGEEWEDMTGSQPPLSPDVFSNASSSYSHRSHRGVRTHQLSWAGSSEASWTGQPRTFRYMSHPARLEHYLRRNTIVEEGEQPVTDQPSTSVAVEVSAEEAVESLADQPRQEKRWLLPNPYNKINQRFHSTLQCPCCLFFCFLCCLPAVYFMQISDKEFDYGTKEKARIYGKKATVLYIIGAIVAVILLTTVASVVVIFLQEYLTRKET